MRKLILLTVLASVMMITGCEKDDEVNQTSFLKKRWIESFEEKTSEEIEIYRSGAYEDFPPTWYRQAFYFDDNDVCRYSVLAPDDGHYMTTGSWKYDEKTNIIKILNSDSEILYEFEVVGVTNNLLKLRAKN